MDWVKTVLGGMIGKPAQDICVGTQNAGWMVTKNAMTAVIVDKASRREIAALDVFPDGLIVPGVPEMSMDEDGE